METISPLLGVVIMMNNYFHDVATGLLVASAISLYVVMKQYEGTDSPQTDAFFIRVYDSMTRLARFAFWWIIIGGVPRTYFYTSFEWANSVAGLQVPAIIVKHVIVFALVGMGINMWIKLNRKVRQVRQSIAEVSG